MRAGPVGCAPLYILSLSRWVSWYERRRVFVRVSSWVSLRAERPCCKPGHRYGYTTGAFLSSRGVCSSLYSWIRRLL